MLNCILKVEGIAGSHVSDIGAEIIRLAKLLGVMIECNVNGVRLLATSASTLSELERDYTSLLRDAADD